MTTPSPKRRPRRFLQFSLRSLLVFVLLASIGMSWLGVKLERARRQREAVEAVVKAGGWVYYDYEFHDDDVGEEFVPKWARELFGDDFFFDVVGVGMFFQDFGDDEATCLKELTGLEGGHFGFSQITDAGLENIEKLADLKGLSLEIRGITDAGLKHLEGMTNLFGLELNDTKITDAGLEHVEGLATLEWLHLRDTQVGDDGLEHLKGLNNLRHLTLTETRITDAGLEHLIGLRGLTLLDLSGTQVTPEGVKKLQEALPKCEIFYDE